MSSNTNPVLSTRKTFIIQMKFSNGHWKDWEHPFKDDEKGRLGRLRELDPDAEFRLIERVITDSIVPE